MEDVINVIQRKIWTVEEILSQLGEIKENAGKLSSKEKERFPRFSNDWSEEGVRKYLKEIEKAVKDPIRYKNKKRLEEIGVKADGIPEDIFEDTLGVDGLLKLFEEIKNINENINEILITEIILVSWFKEGMDSTREKLEEIVNAKPAFERVLKSGVNEKFKSDLLKRSILDISFLSKAEDVISKFVHLRDYEVILEYESGFEKFCKNLDETWSKIQQIQENYGISKEEIKKPTKGKKLVEVTELLKKMDEKYAEKKRKLLEEWNMYTSTLKSLGEGVSEPPESLRELEKAIKDLRNKCLKYLGESGLKLLRFFKGEDEFPADAGMEEIKKALETLRPFFLKSFMEER